jgi:MFS family permease
VCAGLLWCAQGAIMMSYPPEESKGRYISWFWMIFNLGAVIGSLVCHAPSSCNTSHKLRTTFANHRRFPWVRTLTPKAPRLSMMALTLASSSLP